MSHPGRAVPRVRRRRPSGLDVLLTSIGLFLAVLALLAWQMRTSAVGGAKATVAKAPPGRTVIRLIVRRTVVTRVIPGRVILLPPAGGASAATASPRSPVAMSSASVPVPTASAAPAPAATPPAASPPVANPSAPSTPAPSPPAASSPAPSPPLVSRSS
jgi:hypothetical protein